MVGRIVQKYKSTTAYIRLKNGIKAPESGSEKLNGKSMSEQIGSEIFIDTWALINPNQPKKLQIWPETPQVSVYDGLAVEAAVLLAVMESMAFEQPDIDCLLDESLKFVQNEFLVSLVQELRERCKMAEDWKEVRDWIAREHGYDKYPGNCPMVTNHLTLLMSLIMGGDDFAKACMIACSAGWDTDCNSETSDV